MRKWADRIDYQGAPRRLGYTFTLEAGEGLRFREDGRGCKLWYLGDAEYDKAHTEADSAAEDERRAERRKLIEIALSAEDPEQAREAMSKLQWTTSP
jgi:hypothetical protein